MPDDPRNTEVITPVGPIVEEKVLEVFKDVPGFDLRTLVLKYGEDLLDLQFCSCVTKYKKRFAAFLNEFPDFLTETELIAVNLAEQGYREIDVKDILEYQRTDVKLSTPFSEYMLKYSHDFDLDVLSRAYLVRKMLMTNPALFGVFSLSPVKCKSSCGYPNDSDVEEETSSDIAGF